MRTRAFGAAAMLLVVAALIAAPLGLKPYGIEIAPAGDVALVANIGAGATGGADTVSIIDLTGDPPRAID